MKKYIAFWVMMIALPNLALAHGGGCRKADIPKCCHMDRSAGKAHCH